MRRSAFSKVRKARTLTMKEASSFQRPASQTPPAGSWWLPLRHLLLLPGLLHPRGLALQLAEEVQLGAADLGRAQHVDLVDDRRVQREDALDALAERHLAHRERRARAAAVHPDDHALEHLDALLVPFAHLHVHAHGIARLDRRALGELSALDGLNGCHDVTPFPFATNPDGGCVCARA